MSNEDDDSVGDGSSASEGDNSPERNETGSEQKEEPVVATPDTDQELNEKTVGKSSQESEETNAPAVQKSIGWEHNWAGSEGQADVLAQGKSSSGNNQAEGSVSLFHYKTELKSEIKVDVDKKELNLTPVQAKFEGSVFHAEAKDEFDVGSWLKGLFGAQSAKSSSAGGGSGGGGGGGGPFAARVGDMHTCPMVTGTVPHVGGPILPPGCPTVLIGMMPAARVGDMLTCVGPPDTIAMGSNTVLIGNMPAARMGDQTDHGGVIILGCPTVQIGTSGGGGGGGGSASSGTGLKANVSAEGDLDYVRAEAEVSLKINKDGVEGVAKIGGMVAVARGQVQGSLTIPLPFGHKVTFGATAEGMAGAAGAQAEASAGYSKDKGYHATAGVKAGAGLGGGLSFSIGLQ